MNKIKTSELISKFALASEEACKCEDENFELTFLRIATQKNLDDPITVKEIAQLLHTVSDFNRCVFVRTICKVLQDLDIIEEDVDIFDNNNFYSEWKKHLENRLP